MKINDKQLSDLVKRTGQYFPTFGGGQLSNYNPIVNALSDKPYQFAAGVDIENVVSFILSELNIKH